MAEKRSHIRYALNADINIKTEDGNLYVLKNGVSNVSFRGATIFSTERLDLENKIVQFEIVTNLAKESLAGKGSIKYIVKVENKDCPLAFKIGLQFIDINKITIQHFISRLQEIKSSQIRKMHKSKKACSGYLGAY